LRGLLHPLFFCCVQIYFNGQNIGTKIIDMINAIIVRGNPTRMKSLKRYLPGP